MAIVILTQYHFVVFKSIQGQSLSQLPSSLLEWDGIQIWPAKRLLRSHVCCQTILPFNLDLNFLIILIGGGINKMELKSPVKVKTTF